MKRTVKYITILSIPLLFAACDDDGSSAIDSNGKRDVVGSLYELGKCSSVNSGERIFVESEGSYYECLNVCSRYAAWDNAGVGDPGVTPGGGDSDMNACYDWVGKSTANERDSRSSNAKSSSSVIDQTTHYSSAAEAAYENE